MNPIKFVTGHAWGIVLGAVAYECYYRKMAGRGK
jgi:hypothetical protein